ncbi:MAG: DUF2281 domain-containing protein [Solirubrobacterales bacterium]|nr:DUF2281 domain-containing protein [Cytophagales bacterium]MBW8060676.1 DUF2281 domain-containing protein [Solirubrobacterales bacterium]
MQLKLNIAYQQVFNLLKQLPVAEWKKLRGEIDKELTEKKQNLSPTKRGNYKREKGFGCLKGKVWMADDFNEPLDDFKEYMP